MPSSQTSTPEAPAAPAASAKARVTYVVTRAFGDYAVGEAITDPREIDDLKAGDHMDKVVPTVIPAAPSA